MGRCYDWVHEQVFFLFGVCACAPTKTLNPKPETLIWARGQWRVRALIRVDEDGKQGDACCVPKPRTLNPNLGSGGYALSSEVKKMANKETLVLWGAHETC